jgi:anhydro-N-acetylmuramic acid kinase
MKISNTTDTSLNQYYLGIMSGTSLDGIDVALVSISKNENKTIFIAGEEFSFDDDLRKKILMLCETQTTSLQNLGEITSELSLAYADAINLFLIKQKIDAKQIRALGCHGQTVFHQPAGNNAFSMQLVDGAKIAANTHITTVTDFRSMDIALGGQGAPLVPLFHQGLVEQVQAGVSESMVFLNIGGIANISVVNPTPLSGFDTGPGNVLLDSWIYKISGKRYDKNGELSKKGKCNEKLLNLLLSEPYFDLTAPKSTGRERFNLAWLESKLTLLNQKISDVDVMATLIALTCEPIIKALIDYPPGQLLVCGGGTKNKALMEYLKNALAQWQVKVTDDVGISADYMEAMAFAWLAHRCINRLVGNEPQVTGAKRAQICGAITQILN